MNTQNNEQLTYVNQFDESNPLPEFIAKEKPKRVFSGVESVFAWLSLIAGYIFCRFFPASDKPLGTVIFIFGLFISTFIVLTVKKAKITLTAILTAISALIISLALILSDNAFLNFFAYSYALAAYFYFVYSSGGNCLQNGFSNFVLADFIRALFVLPFSSFGYIFKAMFSSRSGKKLPLKILAGLGIAFIPTAIVLSLLSYDSSFSNLWNSIFKLDFLSVFSHIVSLTFGIPIGMYIFGSFVSSTDNRCSDVLTQEAYRKTSEKLKKLPSLTAVFATVPVLFVYLIFFISQWKYYVSCFTGVLPESLSYAEYAREGFSQLCTVSVINLIMILAVTLFTRCTEGGKPSVAIKLLTVVFSASTLILISTAIAKMVMYIDFYGLTQKRIYSTWLMVIIAIIFIFIVIRQIAPKFKTIALSFTVAVALFAVLALSNVNGVIAKYNVEHYISGDLETVDVRALTDLGDAAVPELVNLYEHIDEKLEETGKISTEDYKLRNDVKNRLELFEARYAQSDDNVFSLDLPRYRAERAIKNWNK